MQNIFHSAKATNSLYLKCCSRKFKLSGYLIKWNFNLKKMNAQYIAFFKHKSTSNLINLVNETTDGINQWTLTEETEKKNPDSY